MIYNKQTGLGVAMVYRGLSKLFTVAAMGTLLAACTTYDVRDPLAEVQACFDDHDQAAEDGFQKPACETVGDPSFGEPLASHEGGYGSGAVGRPHMHSTTRAARSWLEPDEPFVIDGVVQRGHERSTEFTIRVLLDDEFVPFRLFGVDAPGAWPSLEEIERLDETDYDLQTSLRTESGVPVNYTLVVPPHAFPTEGRYNLRVLFLPRFAASMESGLLAEFAPAHRTYTVSYGSETPADPNPWGEPREPELTALGPIAREKLTLLGGHLLLPPADIYNIEAAGHPQEVRLEQAFRTGDPSTTLYLHAAGDRFPSDTTGQNLYLILRDADLVDAFLADPQPDLTEFDDRQFIDGDQLSSVFPIAADLSQEPAIWRALVFPLPLQEQRYDRRRDTRPDNSNAIIIERE